MPISPPTPLGDEFLDPLGTWSGYDFYSEQDRYFASTSTAGVTLRSFVDQSEGVPKQLLAFCGDTMQELSSMTVNQVEQASFVVNDENWIGPVTVGKDSAYRNSNTLRCNFGAGNTLITSVMTDKPIDITGGRNTSIVRMAFTSTQNFSNVLDTSFFEMTSSPTGSFDGADVVRVPLIGLGGLWNGGFARFIDSGSVPGTHAVFTRPGQPRGDMGTFDRKGVTGVRFSIDSSGVGNFTAVGLYTNGFRTNGIYVYRDTLRGRLYSVPRTPPLSLANPQMPIAWKSAGALAGQGDPKPYDVEFEISFYTGIVQNGGSISLFARENTNDPVTMVDLNGTFLASLNGKDLPQYSDTSAYVPRTQQELSTLTQGLLNAEDQISLSRTPDGTIANYAKFAVSWTSSSASISMGSEESIPYTYNIPEGLDPESRYVMFVRLVGNTAQMLIYNSSLSNEIGTLVIDSGPVTNENTWPRARGRIGWQANLLDGDAYLDGIRDRKAVFGEYRSRPMRSITPVDGVQLFAEHTTETEHFKSFEEGPINAVTTTVTREGSAWKVSTSGITGFQGVISNLFSLFNLENSNISFSFQVDESSGLRPDDFGVFLVDEYNSQYRQLTTSPFPIGEKEVVRALVPNLYTEGNRWAISAARSRIAIVQVAGRRSEWRVDNPSISTPSITWSARPSLPSPFDANQDQFIPFRGFVGDSKSLQFSTRGSELQVRGEVLRQDAEISKIQILPKYAQLGRILSP